MWKIKLKLDSTNSKMVITMDLLFLNKSIFLPKKFLIQLLCDLPRLVGFLHQREGAKIVLLDVLLEWCSDPTTDISSIGAAFNLISHEYRLDFVVIVSFSSFDFEAFFQHNVPGNT